MTRNRLIEGRAQPQGDFTPRFASKADHAAHLNANLKRDDIEWIVDSNLNLRLVDREDWSERRSKEIAEERESERQRYNWRMQHPIDEQPHPMPKAGRGA